MVAFTLVHQQLAEDLFLVTNDTISDNLYFYLLLKRPFVSVQIPSHRNTCHLAKLGFDAEINWISFLGEW